MAQEIFFDLKIATGGTLSTLDEVKARLKEIKSELGKTTDGKEFETLSKEGAKLESSVRGFNNQVKVAGTAGANSINALRARVNSLNQQLDNTDRGSEAFKKLSSESRKATDELKKLEAQTGRNQRNVGNYRDDFISAFKQMALAAVSVTAILGTIKALVVDSIAAYNKEAQAINQLSVALDGNVTALVEQAAALQRKTLFGDEDIIQAQTRLALFKLEQDQIKQLTPLILDLAAAKGIDLTTAADAVAKAVTGSADALKKQLGVSVKEGANDVERLKLVMEGLNEAVGGQAEAAVGVGTGALTQLGNRVSDLQEKLGGLLLKGMQPIINVVDVFLKGLEFIANGFQAPIDEAEKFANQLFKTSDEARKFTRGVFDMQISLKELELKRLVDAGDAPAVAVATLTGEIDALRASLVKMDEEDKAAAGEKGEGKGIVGETQTAFEKLQETASKLRKELETQSLTSFKTDTLLNYKDAINEIAFAQARLNTELGNTERAMMLLPGAIQSVKDATPPAPILAVPFQEVTTATFAWTNTLEDTQKVIGGLQSAATDFGASLQNLGQIAGLSSEEMVKFTALEQLAVSSLNVALGIKAILTSAGQPFPVNLVAIASTIAAITKGLTSVKALATFQEGGIIEGKSHKEGGVPARLARGGMVELEGGEAIINKKSTALFSKELSNINAYGGFGKKFQFGGIPQFQSDGSTSSDILNAIRRININPVVSVVEIDRVQSNVNVIETANRL